MESKIIYNIDKFITFLFGENNYNDPEQRIYIKLLRLEGVELENWMNEKVKKYITGTDYYFEFKGDKFEGIHGSVLFKTWHLDNIYNKNKEVITMEEIFGEKSYTLIRFKKEYKIIEDKIKNFKKEEVYYDLQLNWRMLIFMDYFIMYIMSMSSQELKSYIIQLMDPVEIK
jgi:succinate dehydrogenase flavin-adding protein (antitoxin of CptAB toxin-antitoxin module)